MRNRESASGREREREATITKGGEKEVAMAEKKWSKEELETEVKKKIVARAPEFKAQARYQLPLPLNPCKINAIILPCLLPFSIIHIYFSLF